MRIKSIRIQGFKSFYNEVELRLRDGICAIVGPNGCGKSNILDAIRWVLGEQNPRKLRGKNMEDVLFNGTDQIPASGMARVSLSFAPHRGSFPYPYNEYEELCIERFLYRTGESEYRINQMPVRLKDVLDLFLDTGSGSRAYSIIPQGYVAEIISATPEQKRLFVEEAAGIVKYKNRKTAALKKIEATRENMRHIEAILSEIRRQMNALKRQAQKARRYCDLKEQIKDLEVRLLAGEYASLEKKSLALASEKEEVEKNLAKLVAEEARLDAELEQVRTELVSCGKRAEEKRALLSDRILERNRLESKRGYLKQSLEDLEKNTGEGWKSLEDLRRQLADTETEQRELEEQTQAAATQSQRYERELEETRARYKDVCNREKEVLERLERTKGTLFDCMTKKAEIRNKQAALQERAKDLQRRIDQGKAEIGALRKETEDILVRHRESEAKREQLRRQRGLLLLQKAACAFYGKTLEGEIRDLGQRAETLQEALHRKRSRLVSLRELEESYEGYQDGVKAIMHRRREDEEFRAAVLGMVADVIETDREYETALESVLGDRLQYMIVEQQQDGLQAIQYLKSQTLGRGSFIPLELRVHPARLDDGGEKSSAVPMMDLVRVKEGYEKVAHYLLGDVIFVPDLDLGLARWRENGRHERIVTREGDLIDPSGVITGGRANGATEARFFRTKREIRELEAEVEALEAEYDRCRGLLEQAQRRFRINTGDFERIQEAMRSLDMEIWKAERDCQQAQEAVKKNEHRLEILEGEGRLFEAEWTECGQQEEACLLEASRLEERLSGEEKELSDASEDAREWSRNREALREELGKKEIEFELVRERLSHLLARKREGEARLGTLRAATAAKENECLLNQEKASSTRLELKTTEEELVAVEAARQSLDTELRELQGTMESQNASAQALDQRLRALRKDVEECRRMREDLQLKLTEVGLKKDNLREQLFEKYGMAISEVEMEGAGDVPAGEMREKLDGLYAALQGLGEVNPAAIEEFEELERRNAFYQEQYEDLQASLEALQRLIQKINRITRDRFLEAFEGINRQFQLVFPKLFNGGKACLKMEEGKGPLEAGIEIIAQPPGKKLQNIHLLSGGEKSLAALALILALFQYKPSPFCILDEVDAALDDTNVSRFNQVVQEISRSVQFILITHNKQTMEIADTLFGVTMDSPGVSSVVSVQVQ